MYANAQTRLELYRIQWCHSKIGLYIIWERIMLLFLKSAVPGTKPKSILNFSEIKVVNYETRLQTIQ